MEQVAIVVPDSRMEEILKPRIVYTVPDTVWVADAETMQLLDLPEITVQEATKVILIPKMAGG